ncbi:MAG: Uma2 family endonuclease [Ignavibacteria bacterium]|nr:Uma2 family endonuclease [Ignavibacteria bacterium]
MIGAIKKKYTFEDYEKLPEGSPFQLIDGELIITPAPIPYHQQLCKKIFIELSKYVEREKIGELLFSPIDVFLSESETYQPDIIFISNDRLNIIGEKKIEGAPDLIVEILSEATAYYDLKHKKRIYESSGVKEYWIVDPIEKSIEVYENANLTYKLFSSAILQGKVNSKLLNGFEVEISKIF